MINNTVNATIEKIKELSDVSNADFSNVGNLAYRLGMIYEICSNAISESKEEVKSVVEETKKEEKSFQEYCEELKNSCTDEDEQMVKLLERNGSHMNLKFVIHDRWPNKSYAKTVTDILASHNICTMNDLIQIFDNPDNLRMLRYPGSVNKDDLNKFNKDIFPIYKLSASDKEKFDNIYCTANEYKDKDQVAILYNFVNEESARICNALYRYANICNVNQLYFYLSTHKLSDFKKIRGIGHVPDSVNRMYYYIHKEK